MTIPDKEQLLRDFETLADEKHHPSVFRASERIRQYVEALERHASDLRELALDGPSEVKGAPGGESYWNWRQRIEAETRFLSKVKP